MAENGMKKAKLFIDNFFVFGLGGIISKLVPLIMLPIITRLLPDTVYVGVSDLGMTVASFGAALATLGMYDAMYRKFFDFEKKDEKIALCTTSTLFVAISSFIVGFIFILFRSAICVGLFGSDEYLILVFISALTVIFKTTNPFFLAPSRMQNHRKIFVLTNVLTAIVNYSVVILFICLGQYLIAIPIAMLISSVISSAILFYINREWFDFRLIDLKIIRPLLKIGLPMMPNFVFYWVMASCDRLFVSKFLGVAENGVYSVGSKMGSISQLIYIAFAGGWHYFAFSTMNEPDQVRTTSRVFEYLSALSICGMIGAMNWSKVLYSFMFNGDYQKGYIVAPYLFFAPLLLMLYQTVSNQFLIIKKTGPAAFFLLIGVCINVGLNFVLIPQMGIEGAAIATLSGYVVALVLCCIKLHEIKLITFSRRYIISMLVLTVYFIVYRFVWNANIGLLSLFGGGSVLCILLLYIREIRSILFFINKRVFGNGNDNVSNVTD